MKAIACARPRQLHLPLARLQVPDIRAEAIRQGLVAEISGTTSWRWLCDDALRPWAHRSQAVRDRASVPVPPERRGARRAASRGTTFLI